MLTWFTRSLGVLHGQALLIGEAGGVIVDADVTVELLGEPPDLTCRRKRQADGAVVQLGDANEQPPARQRGGCSCYRRHPPIGSPRRPYRAGATRPARVAIIAIGKSSLAMGPGYSGWSATNERNHRCGSVRA